MQRKATKNTRGPNADEKRYVTWIKERDWCAACGSEELVIAHHCEGSCFKHNKVLVGHWFVIGLCEYCDGIITKGNRKTFREYFGPQSMLWNDCTGKYFEETGNKPPYDVAEAILDWGK